MSNASAINLGSCWGTPGGQDLSMPSYMASGLLCVGEAIARRWSTSPGELIDDPAYGTNLTDLVSDDLSPTDVARMQQRLAAEALKDPRVLKASVSLTLVNGLLTATGSFTTAAGPFTLVASVSSLTPLSFVVST